MRQAAESKKKGKNRRTANGTHEGTLTFTGERIVPGSKDCEPKFAQKMYQEHAARYLFASQITQGKSVLDVGCGVGYGARLLADHGAKQVLAIDIADDAVNHAKRFYNHDKIDFQVASAQDFAFDRKFDVITCFELIEHVHQQEAVVANLAQHLAPNGTLLISTPRALEAKRSEFHTTEFSLGEFKRLLARHFAELEFYFENNHFVSLVSPDIPSRIERMEFLEPEALSLPGADYFLCLASHTKREGPALEPEMVVNDDKYVQLLERDVGILGEAHKNTTLELQSAQQLLESERKGYQEQHARWETETSQRKREHKQAVEALDAECEKVRALTREVDALRLTNQQRSEQLKLNEADAKNIRVQLDERQVQNSRLLESERSLQDSVAQLTIRVQEADQATQRQREACLSAQTQNERLAEENRALNEKLGALDALRAQVSELTQQLQSLAQQNTSLDLQVRRARDHAQGVRAYFENSRSWQMTKPLRESKRGLQTYRQRVQGKVLSLKNRVKDALRPDPAPGVPEVETDPTPPTPVVAEAAPIVAPPPQVRPQPFAADVLFLIGCNEGESKRYRVFNVQEALESSGARTMAFTEGDIPRLLKRGFRAKSLVLFRLGYAPNVEELIAVARREGVQVVFDVDDLVFEPESIDLVRVVKTFSKADRALYLEGVERYRKTLEASDLVTCTTGFLAERVRALGKEAHVIPNTLNAEQIRAAESFNTEDKGRQKTVRVGYFSGSNTHQVDFKNCEDALLKVMEEHPKVVFVLVGILDLSPKWKRFEDRIERHGFMPHLEMLQVLSSIDINMAPLEQGNPYCEAKSQLKVFEAGLVRVPTVASATSSYSDSIDEGKDGFLAKSKTEWHRALVKLVKSPKLRREVGEQARSRALKQFTPQAMASNVSRVLLKEDRSRVSVLHPEAKRSISWIIPGLPAGSGGHRNILRVAYFLQQFGHDLRLYFVDTEESADVLAERVREKFYPIECPIERYDGHIEKTDVLFATHWTTVSVALKHREKAGQLAYFVQDFEPLFHQMGSDYIMAENTYRQGLHPITSGPWCAHLLRKDFGVPAEHFIFPIDRSIYYPRERTDDTPRLVFFARPEMPRRCFELGTQMLTELKGMMPELEIVMYGSKGVAASDLPFPAITKSLLPSLDDLAALYSSADVGIAFSTTNPSLVPYEMLSCGLPVIDLDRKDAEINYGGRRDIALLVNPVPERMAAEVFDFLKDPEARAQRRQAGIDFVSSFPSEEQMVRTVEQFILGLPQ